MPLRLSDKPASADRLRRPLIAKPQNREALRDKVSISRYELINPRVQRVGDAAVLTFNYVSYGGTEDAHRWNCTEVYRRSGDRWEIIETHWSHTKAVRA